MLNKHLPKFITLSLSVTLALVGLICVLGLLGRLSQVAHAQGGTGAVYVHPTGNDFVGCGPYGLPCRTIKYAVETEAQSGDVVQVFAGVYTETFSMQPGVVISSVSGYGVTIIDGEGVRGPMVSASGAGITEAAVLRGFTVRRGLATTSGGAGLFIDAGASPVIESCFISDNQTNNQLGGGVYIGNGASPVISNCEVSNNRNNFSGGGIYSSGSPHLINVVVFSNSTTSGSGGGINVGGSGPLPVIENSAIYSNSAGGWGGGIYHEGVTITVRNTRIYQNVSTQNGGGIYNASASMFLENNIFYHNRAGSGGAIYINQNPIGTVRISNNTIYSNTVTSSGGGIFIQGTASPVISNSIVVSNTALVGGGIYFNDFSPTGSPSLDYNDVWGNIASPLNPGTDNYAGFSSITSGTHSISVDPVFSDVINYDFHLTADSPCIDTGDPNTTLNTDFEGNKRPSGSGYDMGAYEYQSGTDTYLPIVIKN